jgi:hypothetical protein
VTSHPLIGATVELLDNPRFEGRNHVLAEDGFEAVVPFHLRVSQGPFVLQRRFVDDMRFPPESSADRSLFQQLQASGVNISPGAIGEVTGIFDIGTIWQARTATLEADLAQTSDEMVRAALLARIKAMSNPANARFFGARMQYMVPLQGTASVVDPQAYLPGTADTDPQGAWPLELWFGAWDPDAVCGYMQGYLGVPLQTGAPDVSQGLAHMMSEPRDRRR